MQPTTNQKYRQSGFGKPDMVIFLLLIISLIAAAFCFIQANSKSIRNRVLIDVVGEFKAVASQLVIENVAHTESGPLLNNTVGYRLLEILKNGNASISDSTVPDILDPELEAIERSWSNFVDSLGDSQQRRQASIVSFSEGQLDTLQGLNTSLMVWFQKIQVGAFQSEAVDTISSELLKIKRLANSKAPDDVRQAMVFSWGVLTSNLEKLMTVSDVDAQVLLSEMKSEVNRLNPAFDIDLKREMANDESNSAKLLAKHAELQLVLNNLQAAVKVMEHEQNYLFRLGVVAALLSLLFVFILAIVFWRNSQAEIERSKRSNSTNQRAILRLLDEITNLAKGDLTTRATVTEDITGAIADSVNFAIETITDLVETISKTSEQVKDAAIKTGGIAKKLSRASNLQNREIRRSSNYITAMANVMKQLSQKASKAKDVADHAVLRATAGQAAVSETIESTQQIRNSIQDTSKRLKRLGESSQQIGEIIRLVNDIAERTNLLALNASIQASSVNGQNGGGISTVSNEVQILAEQVNQATRDIGALIDTIQVDTRAAIDSMETSTEGVVRVSGLAEQAGVELSEIQIVSEQLSGQIQSIAERSSRQAEVISKLSGNMRVISDIAKQTNEGMSTTIESISSLQSMSQDLTKVVGRFKLPDSYADEHTLKLKVD